MGTQEKLSDEKTHILTEWKKNYIEASVDALKPNGNTLEIGFSAGFGANAIQRHHPKTHTIIEANPVLFEKAKKWVGDKPNIVLINGRWKDVLSKLGKFDAIFFNDYFPDEQDRLITNFLFPEDINKTLQKAKNLIGILDQQISQLKVKFSDRQIEDFYEKIGKFHSEELPAFFKKLKENGNISDSQYKECAEKYFHDSGANLGKTVQETSQDNSEMLKCLEECLKNHMSVGSRFSAFSNTQISNYEDPDFFDSIIINPDIDYNENLITIKLSDKSRNAFVMLAEKSV